MKKEIAHLLADAITSGHYQRTSGNNRRVDPETGANSFCIGGVLINLFAQAHPKLAAKEKDPYMFMGTAARLPHAVADWADLDSVFMAAIDNKYITIAGYKFTSLQSANDQRRGRPSARRVAVAGAPFQVSWEEIATWLRTGENHKLI